MDNPEDMIGLAYDCKVCGDPRVARYHKDCPPLRLNIWLASLTCNRCYDFEIGLLRKRDQIAAVAHAMNPVKRPSPETLSQLENGLRALVQQSCDLITDFLRVPRSTYPELMQGALRDPQQAWPGILWFRKEAFRQAGWQRKTETQPELVEDRQENYA